VAEEVGVTEETLKEWESAVRAKVLPKMDDAAVLLKLGPDGPINRDPLAKWQVRFYPESGRWRRTRSNREEVSRSVVAKKVGVSEEILVQWEAAIMAAKETP
jgi:DNA-binding XRE family transcriptional regulator